MVDEDAVEIEDLIILTDNYGWTSA